MTSSPDAWNPVECGTGRLFGVGVGPGDPELVTVRAARLIAEADVVAYHSARHGRSIARSIAAPYLRDGQVEEAMVYPVTTEGTDHPGGYQGAIDDFYAECADRLAKHLEDGCTVVVLSEGDPFFYGSYMHLHKRLAHRFPTTVVPGVTSVSAASAALGRPLVERDEVLTIAPGTLPPDVLAGHLQRADAAVVMKLGRTFPAVRQAFELDGSLEDAYYVERASHPHERTAPLADVDASTVPYMAVAVRPTRSGLPVTETVTEAPSRAGAPVAGVQDHGGEGTASAPAPAAAVGEVVVVGLGPAGPQWLTPEAEQALAVADHLVGYEPYLARVPVRAGQQRHPSDNRVESERAAFALDLALRGGRVAVVSSGDPGVFAMAAAVLEVACEPRWSAVPVRVLPGLSAAHAAASRVGAPLGHDFAVLSLSDRLKPWDVVAARLSAAAAADLVLAVYNPASRSRTWQVGAARDLLLEHRSPDTPVVVARDVGRPGEDVRVVRLADLDPDTVDMRCLLIVGSSQTTAVTRDDGTTVVWTSRRYPG